MHEVIIMLRCLVYLKIAHLVPFQHNLNATPQSNRILFLYTRCVKSAILWDSFLRESPRRLAPEGEFALRNWSSEARVGNTAAKELLSTFT
jgi:hypothetical protein